MHMHMHVHMHMHMYPPPPVPKNHLAQEPTPGSAVKFSHHFFYQGSGFFMFLVDVGPLFRCAGHHFMCVTMGPPIRGDPISHSQAHVCFCTTSSIPCSVPQTFPCTLPVRVGSTDRNSGWCITGRRVSRLSQLNSRSSHARWKAHYSPVSCDSLLWCSFVNVVNCGKGEGTHVPAQRAGKFFFRGTGLPTAVRKNQPLVPRSNLGGKVCARTNPWFRGQTLLVLGHGGGGGTCMRPKVVHLPS